MVFLRHHSVGTDELMKRPLAGGSLEQIWARGGPPDGVFLFYGHFQVLIFSQRLAARYLARTGHLIVLDGANVFDPYLMASAARDQGYTPQDFLRRILVSRSFTSHQMLSLLRKTQSMLELSQNSILLLLGPLTSFYDESVPEYESRPMFGVFKRELKRLTSLGCRLWLACQEPSGGTRRRFVEQLKTQAAGIASCWQLEEGVVRARKSGSYRPVQGSRGVTQWVVTIERPVTQRRSWTLGDGQA